MHLEKALSTQIALVFNPYVFCYWEGPVAFRDCLLVQLFNLLLCFLHRQLYRISSGVFDPDRMRTASAARTQPAAKRKSSRLVAGCAWGRSHLCCTLATAVRCPRKEDWGWRLSRDWGGFHLYRRVFTLSGALLVA